MILTGGDPFILSPRRAEEISQRLAAIAHVKIVRWHTRVPMVDPARVTRRFRRRADGAGRHQLGGDPCQSSAANFRRRRARAIARLVDAGIALVSQCVLLQGRQRRCRNPGGADARLCREPASSLIICIIPTWRAGTSHFRLGIEEGLALTRALRARLSGLAQPTYVLDIPGGFGKVALDSANVEKTAAGHRIRDFAGAWHDYPA